MIDENTPTSTLIEELAKAHVAFLRAQLDRKEQDIKTLLLMLNERDIEIARLKQK